MRSKKLLSMLLVFVLLVSCVSFSSASLASANSSSSLYDKLQELEKNLEDVKRQKNSESVVQSELQLEIEETQTKIDELNIQMDELNLDVNQLNLEVENLKRDITQKQSSIDTNWETLKQRIRAMYMAGDTSTLEMLLSSTSIADFMTRSEMLKSITKHDSELIAALKEDMASLETDKAEVQGRIDEINKKKEEMAASKKEFDSQQSVLETQYQKSNDLLQSLMRDEKAYQEELDAMNAELTGIYGNTPAIPEEDFADYSNDGSMAWPLPGYSKISSGYGPRWGRNHNGIDITGGGVYGASIVSARGGTVIAARNSGSYGKYLIIQHADGISTLYAHCSALLVSEGQSVSKGETIARVGNTGNSTGPHLHFEVRVNGSAVNPRNYV